MIRERGMNMSPEIAMISTSIAIVGAVILVSRGLREYKVKKCTQMTQGKIVDVKHVEGSSSTTHYFIIRYSVNHQKYSLSQTAWGLSSSGKGGSSYESHIGEWVTVHYDDEKPKRAWAETPGKHRYSSYVQNRRNQG